MLVNEAIAFAEQELKRSNNLNSRLDSEILVSHLINIPRESIYSKLKENLPSNKNEELQNLVSRRVKKEPIAYILNNKEFWSTNFYVDRSVLIPRTETEVLIDLILSQINNKNNYLNILDIGTGSGCILISLLKELAKAKAIGVDKSSKAIAIAKKNSISQQVDSRSSFKNVNLENIKFDKKFDLIVSNPPYLPDVSLKNLNLDIKLYDLQRSQQESERAKARKSQIGTGDRSERIRTYNFPQGRVTDHRINMTLYKLTDFLAGDAFKELSDAIQIQFQEEQLENLKI